MIKYLSVLLAVMLFVSCKSKIDTLEQISVNIDCPNYIDFDAESNIYVLDILDSYPDNLYHMDDMGKCTLLVNNKVYIDSVYYSGIKDVNKAVFASKSDTSAKIGQVISISIKTNNNDFEEVFRFCNPVNIYEHGYGYYQLKVQLEETNIYYKQKQHNGLKIIFSETDFGNGVRFWMLNFVKENDSWNIVSKEKFSTQKNDAAYSVDSANYWFTKENNIILLDTNCLFGYK